MAIYLGNTPIAENVTIQQGGGVEIDDTSSTATDKTWSAKKINESVGVGKAGTATNAEIFNNYKQNAAEGYCSHAEGNSTNAFGEASHAEGRSENSIPSNINTSTSNADIITAWNSKNFSLAKGKGAHIEGFSCLAAGDYSHAEGNICLATGNNAHAEGNGVTASGITSHAEGYQTVAAGYISHAEGAATKATGMHSHAEGMGTEALSDQHVQGHYNKLGTAASYAGTTGDAFIIGNGYETTLSNALRVAYSGKIYATNATISTGADYAEYFEWADSNPNNEDRVGHFVAFDENSPKMIRIANSTDDYILGIVSGMPSVIGNGDEDWKKRYVLDDFGRYIPETFTYTDIDGNEQTGTHWKQNPDYDSTKKYISRAERKEWSAVGMLGVLSVRDDGTCQVGSYCNVTDNGIATATKDKTGYRIVRRISDNVVEVVFR